MICDGLLCSSLLKFVKSKSSGIEVFRVPCDRAGLETMPASEEAILKVYFFILELCRFSP